MSATLERIYMSYLGYKEVMELMKCSKGKAYEVILELRTLSGWNDTYECKHLSRIVIPKSVFLKYYPNLKQAIREKEKELSA